MWRLTIGIGLVAIGTCSDPSTMFAVADRRLYLAKRPGKNRVVAAG